MQFCLCSSTIPLQPCSGQLRSSSHRRLSHTFVNGRVDAHIHAPACLLRGSWRCRDMCWWPTCRSVSCLWTICGSSEAASFTTPATLLLCWITAWTDEASGLFIFAVSRVWMRSSRLFLRSVPCWFCKLFLAVHPYWTGLLLPHAEILFGGVYIWGNPQLCFPDPQSINWRDILDQRNTDPKYRLQPRVHNCELQHNHQTPSACFTVQQQHTH